MQDTLNKKAFGKNDIRGIFPSEVNSQLYFYAAKGYVNWVRMQYEKMHNENKPAQDLLICVCKDAR